MAEEAVVRIVLDDSGSSPSADSAPPQSQSGQQPAGTVGQQQNTSSAAPPAPPKSQPIPVDVVSVPPPKPPPAATVSTPSAAATGPQSADWLQSLISPAQGTNPHVLMEGQSGSGKSVATRHIAMERMAMGHEVHVLDPHTPQSWGGAEQVFQGETAGGEAAKFMEELLKERIAENQEAMAKGAKLLPGKDVAVDFKPVTMVLSDFAAIAKNTPALQEIIKQMLTEGRKFNIAILADTTALTGAESGIQGINNVLANFRQKARFYAPTDADPQRRARIGGTGGEVFDVPQLPDYKDRVDYSLVKPTSETGATVATGAEAIARRQLAEEDYRRQIEEAKERLRPKPLPTVDADFFKEFDEEEIQKKRVEKAKARLEAEKELELLDAEYAKLKPAPPPDVEKVKSTLDAFLEISELVRGTLGGTFGTIVGAGLDITSRIRGMQGTSSNLAPEAPIASLAPEAPTATAVASDPNFVGPIPTPTAIPEAVIVGEAAVSLGAKLGMLVPIVAASAVVFSALTSAVDASVNRYADVSPEIAQAQAMVEVRQVMNDIRRGQQYGEGLAKYVEAQGRMQEKFEEAKMKFLSKIAPILEAIFEFLGFAMEGIGAIPEVLESVANPLSSIAGSISESVTMQRDARNDDDAEKDPTSVLFKNEGRGGVEVPVF